MAEIVAAVVFIIIGLGCCVVAFLNLVVAADAAAFNADAGNGPVMLGAAIGALVCFGLAVWLLF